VLRGAAFLCDAMSHGVLPGVAVASLLGRNLFVGAMIAALAMAYGVAVAAVIGAWSVALGLVVSWHAGTAGGATIAAVAVAIFFCSLAAAAIRRRVA
jgi:zinc/manganese transport system permease protein